ncbi:MAG: hypothetical protein JNL83_17570 [Myxococcales bacterium]|nr:hypothetical protein [Myxococcales bacterium]
MNKIWSVGLVAVLVLAVGAGPSDAKPGKDFWKILVKPNAKWVLANTTKNDKSTVTIETYDVRRVGDADVARLRVTHRWGTGKDDAADNSGASGLPVQVAVTAKGLYFLNDTKDDAKILAVIAGKPTRSSPPKAYKATKTNKGRYLRIDGDTVCMGEEPLEDAGECADICEGEVCISATDGVVSLHGTMSPNHDDFAQKGK